MPAERRFTDELRDVADGWRWGRRPMMPRSAEGVTAPPERFEFPTDWARSAAGRVARDVILSGAIKPMLWNETAPSVHGLDNLDGLRAPVMFISNHSSHLDATLILTTLPPRWRTLFCYHRYRATWYNIIYLLRKSKYKLWFSF